MKRELRERAKEKRAELARGQADFAERIAQWADQLPLAAGAIVAGFHPVRDEADPLALMKAIALRGHTLALPVVMPRSELAFVRWSFGDPTNLNRYGICEPATPGELAEPDVILVPLLAFDAEGHRLGYGGGYYDRALARAKAVSIGIAYAGQEVERLPCESHDRRLDLIVTERGVRTFG